MYQAIDAVSRAGVIEPLESVQFEENEHLLILRLSRPWTPSDKTQAKTDWRQLTGVLKASPNLNDNPVQIQQEMRHEWD
jgi:predicted DNA-binding antitoxin AbrB/MazE fold protein